jgi:hypothetical protein
MKQYIYLFVGLIMGLSIKVATAAYLPYDGKTSLRTVSGINNGATPFCDTISISSATPTVSFSSYISAQGGTSFKLAAATGYRESATATNAPNIAVTSLSSTSATFIVTQQNTATTTILGINVLSGAPMVVVPDPQNVKIILSGFIY